MKRSRFRTIIAVAALAVAGTAYSLRTGQAPTARAVDATQASSAAMAVSLFAVSNSEQPQTRAITGSVRPQLESSVATKVQGRVLSVLVREGDRVTRGQVLARLDTRDLDAAVGQAQAGVNVASVGVRNSRVAAEMEAAMSAARIAQAEAGVSNAQSAVQSAMARLQLVQSGPRRQEKAQAVLAVQQAQSGLTLAQKNLARMKALCDDGAISRQQLDLYQSQYDVAKAQYDTAVQSQSMSDEGSRQEDIRGAEESVRQAQAGLTQARAGLGQAHAAAKQADVRRAEIQSAAAQLGQGKAALRMAAVTRDYANIVAPFDGIVAKRLVDPGALASPGVPLITVQGGPLQLQAVAPESALPFVHQGNTISVTLDAIPGVEMKGSITEIAPQGDSSSHTFVVKITLPKSPEVRAGMFGRASVTVGRQPAMLAPRSAVVQREGLAYVYVVDSGSRAYLRLVTLGEDSGASATVLSGLQPGERIVATAASVSDGSVVKESR